MIHLLLFGGCALLIAAFVLEPLFRAEAEIEPLDRTWLGVVPRHDRVSVDGRSRAESDGTRTSNDCTNCLACGSPIEPAYTYCANCLTPSPR